MTDLAKRICEKEKLKQIIHDGVSLNAAIAILESNTFNANINIKNTTDTTIGSVHPSATLPLQNVPILFDNEASVEKQVFAATLSHVPPI